jgi:glycine cleavage system transcriptional repressor
VAKNYIVISAVGPDKTGIVDNLAEAVADSGCNILESRMTAMNSEFAAMLLVSGNWNTLAKLEGMLPAVGEHTGLDITTHRTEPAPSSSNIMPYAVEVVALDQPGIVHQLAHFFASRDISIREMATNTYQTNYTETPMFAIHMNVDIPASQRIATLREEFMDFSDQLNLDSVIEPIKA